MKKKFLSVMLLALLGISLVACGNDGGKTPDGDKVGALDDYTQVPFSIFVERELDDGEIDVRNFVFGTFPEDWKGTSYDSNSYYDYFRKNYGLGSMEVPVVRDGMKLNIDFGDYQPDKITVHRDANTFAVLSAKEEPSNEDISEVELKDNSFIVEYGEDSLLYYIITCQWEGIGTVQYGVVVSAK